MSVSLQLKCLTFNETARKAIESYSEILQKAFQHYQNLWEDYIKLQEKCRQCNVHSSSQVMVNIPCTKTKDETTFQPSNNTNMQESNNIPLLELDTLNISRIDFKSDMITDSSDASESSHKAIDENNPVSPPKSPVFSKTFLKPGGNPVKQLMRSPKAGCNPTLSMKTHSTGKVPPKYNHKLEISTTHHVATTFLPNGKRLKQSRLAFCPRLAKSNEKVVSTSVDKHKPTSTIHNVQQNCIQDVSIANATVTESDATSNVSEISEDVIEISPTQQTSVTSKVKRCLKLKRKIPAKYIKMSPNKNKYLGQNSALNDVPEIIDFQLGPSTKHTSMLMENNKSFTDSTAVNTSKDKVNTNSFSPISLLNKTNIQIKTSIEARKENQLLINKVQNLESINDSNYEDETFYLPAEQAANGNDMDNTENKPPEKKMLLDKFNVLPKRKVDISEQLNMRCKTDRAKLDGWDCWECREYYKNLSLSKEELQKRKNQCSRHRYKYERPNTPEGFWDPEFPETLSCTYRTK